MEISTSAGICSSGMMALKNAYMQVAISEKRNAISVASELPSRIFKSTRYDEMGLLDEDGSLPLEAAFLRYMLSDGAGAAVIENAPAASGISLRIDWISLRSFANTQKTCMYGGSNSNPATKGWMDYPTAAAAEADGALVLRQDLSLLPHLISLGADEWERLSKLGKFDVGHADLDPRTLLKRADEGDRLQRVRPARHQDRTGKVVQQPDIRRQHRLRGHFRHPRRDDDRGPDQEGRHVAVHGSRVRSVRDLLHASDRGVGSCGGSSAMSRRAVVYLYTQTGQLREVAEAFTAPLEADGWRIRWVDVQPRVAFPFPWSIWQFFGVFPRAVDPDALVQLAEPPGGFGAEQDEEEVVLLAYQVWYLSPSLPIRSLLAAHPEAFRNRRVISLIACRNMWYSAAIEVADLLRTAGARRVEVVAATDTRQQATSLMTTLRWLLTGNREPFLWFGRAGVGDAELARVTAVGRSIAEQGTARPTRRPSCRLWPRRISSPGACSGNGA